MAIFAGKRHPSAGSFSHASYECGCHERDYGRGSGDDLQASASQAEQEHPQYNQSDKNIGSVTL